MSVCLIAVAANRQGGCSVTDHILTLAALVILDFVDLHSWQVYCHQSSCLIFHLDVDETRQYEREKNKHASHIDLGRTTTMFYCQSSAFRLCYSSYGIFNIMVHPTRTVIYVSHCKISHFPSDFFFFVELSSHLLTYEIFFSFHSYWFPKLQQNGVFLDKYISFKLKAFLNIVL